MLYPQQNEVRNLLELSGIWDFQPDPDGAGAEGGWAQALPDARPIAVPGSWNEQYSDLRDYLGLCWYRRTFCVPAAWQGSRVRLRVGSAVYHAEVWVNGQRVGAHEGGHLPFEFDVTDALNWHDENSVSIAVENELKPTRVPPGNVPSGMFALMGSYPSASYDFFPYAGLHRPVYLYSVPQQHIEDVTVTTEIDGSTGLVRVVVDQSGVGGSCRLHLKDSVTSVEATVDFDGGRAEALLRVEDAQLWAPGNPHLYELTVSLNDGNVTVDRYRLDVGIRTIAVQGDQILLNGEPIFLKGFGRHEDFAISGRGLNLPLLVKDYSLLKWIGANSYRTSHYPYSEEEMCMADREGILIIDEIPAVGLFFEDDDAGIQTRLDLCKTQMRELVARDKNHPSVIMWSVANEPFPPDMMKRFASHEPMPVDPKTTDFFDELISLTRELDPSRLVTLVGVHGSPNEWHELTDVVCINRYYGWYSQSGQLDEGLKLISAELDALHAALGKPIMVTEFGADTIPGSHAEPAEMWTEEYQVLMISGYLDAADARPFVAGMHIWNFADFKTGQGNRRVNGYNYKGVFTRDRRPKMVAHVLRKRWNA
ncbi:beta-glucuronidase [bacterium]|nr:beta-glucuronidase [bacterium]